MRSVSVGVCAYNEEKNIRRSLESLSSQKLDDFELREIIVVSSGSTDRTDSIVGEYHRIDPRVKLIPQARREGKNSAVNLFISSASGDILVLVNADNSLRPDSLRNLLVFFNDPQVGMVGGHPLPVNSKETVVGFAVHMLWDMHHRLSLVHPKVGELVAFRNLRLTLPTTMQSDEDIIRMELERRGYRTTYAPEAIVLNKGPTTFRDFMKQRTRVNIGEKYMKRLFDYDIPTWNASFLMSSFSSFARDNRKHLGKIFMAMAMEAGARVYATVYVALDKGDKTMWSQVTSTKDVKGE